MTAAEFCTLDDEQREDVLTWEGAHIGERTINGLYFDLYQVHGFYVEFCYQMARQSKVTTRVFSDTESLDPYLPKDLPFNFKENLANS